jgi:sporulation protein YlmC with PRC-barrel domain
MVTIVSKAAGDCKPFMATAAKARYTSSSMLQLSGTIINKPVLSLRTSTVVATDTQPIINPNNLKIEGFYCQDSLDRTRTLVMLYQDIRDLIPQGFVVNDHDVLCEPSELVRLQEVLKLNFDLIGKPVVTVSKERIGKVNDFALDINTMYVQKLYVSQSIFKSFTGGNLGIDRTQIFEITDKRVVIQDLNATVPARASATA